MQRLRALTGGSPTLPRVSEQAKVEARVSQFDLDKLRSIERDLECITPQFPYALKLLQDRIAELKTSHNPDIEKLAAYFKTKMAGGEVDAQIRQWFEDHA